MCRYFRVLAFTYVFCCVVALTPKAGSAADATPGAKPPAASVQNSGPPNIPELERRAAAQEGVSDKDKAFLMTAVQAEMLQRELSRVALAHTKNPAVRRFAGATAQFMGKTRSRLDNIANEFGISFPKITPDEVANAQAALSRSKDSDHEYLTRILADTKTSTNLYKDEGGEGQNPVVAQYAREMLPRLSQHYRNTSRLLATINRDVQARRLRASPSSRS